MTHLQLTLLCLAALEALGKNQEALQAYEKARWLAQAHDNDPQGEQARFRCESPACCCAAFKGGGNWPAPI